MSIADEHRALFQRWRDDPVEFYNDVLLEKYEPLDPWQHEALTALAQHDRIAFVASKGVGKSFLEAVAGFWWMVTRKKAQVICTSITASNLRSGLWKELNGLWTSSPLLQHLFQFNSERVIAKEDPGQWFMEARSWRDHVDAVEQSQALAGLHGPAMLWLGDEAGSYGHAIIASGSAMMANVVPGSGREGKMLLGGNPTDPKGPLGDIARDPENWRVIRINGDPDNPNRSKRISLEWARQEIKKHTRENPWVKVSVLGEFPEVGFKNLLGPDDIDRAKKRAYGEPEFQYAQKRLGVDVALHGDDATVICVRQGLRCGQFVEMRTDDPNKIADRIALAVERSNAEVVYIDKTGIGVSVYHALKLRRVRVVGVDNSQSPVDDRYLNSRAEQWCNLAQWVKDGGWLPVGYDQLERDLMAPEYTYKNSKILIQPKDEIKKLLGRSPDYGDALALTFASPEKPSAPEYLRGMRPGFLEPYTGPKNAQDFDPHRGFSERASIEWDPHAEGKL
jgi:hypothetical protein